MDLPTHGHAPVLPDAVLRFLQPQAGETALDCTVGRGGHAALIAQAMGTGTMIVLDADPTNLTYAQARIKAAAPKVELKCFHANFGEVSDVLAAAGVGKVNMLLADFGVSTNQLLEPGKGLSFQRDEALDMRLDPRIKKSAADLVNGLAERPLADLLFNLAQERLSFRIAREILHARARQPIRTTGELADIIRRVNPPRHGQIDPCTRTFQALRMAVNGEMDVLQELLVSVPALMAPNGRAVFISFHSGEDRLVKQAQRAWAHADACEILTRKPLEAEALELAENPRARSAKLRAVTFASTPGAVASYPFSEEVQDEP